MTLLKLSSVIFNVTNDRLMTYLDLKVTMEKCKKLKCLPREGKLKEYKIRLEDNARSIDIYGAKTNCLISFLNYDELDKKDSPKTWYEVLDRQEIDKGEFELYLYELDNYGKPLTLAKLKKKYGAESNEFKRISKNLEKYGYTKTYYVDVRYDMEYILLANTTVEPIRINQYRDKYKHVIEFDDQSYTSHFFFFNEEGYAILKNKPENYDPEFDNGGYHNDRDFEGIEVPIYGDWNVRKRYLDELNAYKEREAQRPKGVEDHMYSVFMNDAFYYLHEKCIDLGMTEDDFKSLKELLHKSKGGGYHYSRTREIKEFCKKFPDTYKYVTRFIQEAWSTYIDAYNYNCQYGG